MKAIILTQKDCKKCEDLKRYIHEYLPEYEDITIYIEREDSERLFFEMVDLSGATQVPTVLFFSGYQLVDIEDVLSGLHPAKTYELYQKYFSKEG